MTPATIALDAPVRYALEGRLVTMGPQGVIPDGAIYIEDGVIRAVQPAAMAAPAGFEDVPRVRTGDTLYPGLIELHNHLAYNAVPLWLVPRHYTNNGQWRNTHEYRRNVTAPAKVLGNSEGLVEAVIRYVECRSLLGGTTTSQGITLIGTATKDFFPGLVRNVEAPLAPDLPAAGTRISNPPNKEEDKPGYLARQQGLTCLLQHLSEGIDATARNWFLRLRRDDGSWVIADSFCGIHSAALIRADFDTIVAHGGSMVWSPLSNYLLYGETADLAAMAASGIPIALGSDWAPSGSKSLLGELKVAWLANQAAGAPFSAEALVAMATRNAAEILGWDAALGTLEAGKRADVIAIDGKSGDPFMRLIEARDTALTLVVIDGVPRVGQPRLMTRFALDAPEEIRVGGARRLLHLAQEATHPLMQALTLADATDRLADALDRLPDLAAAVDNALLAGLDAGVAGSPLGALRLDLELDDEPLELLAGSLEELVSPMVLEPPTVADDPTFLPKIVAALNAPDFLKEELPALYGEAVPAPFGAEARRVAIPGMPRRVNATVDTLRGFLSGWRRLTREDRTRLVEQALVLLEENYVHLPFKRAMHGIDPVQRLRLLRHQLEQEEVPLGSDMAFHSALTRIFHSMRDLHTSYRLPYPFRGTTAALPFLIESYWDAETAQDRYIISKVVGDSLPKEMEGVEVLYWNGVPIETAVAVNADRHAGSNPDARRARGLNSLTIRPLGRGLPPDEDWVRIRYRNGDGRVRELRQEWLVFVPERAFAAPVHAEGETLRASARGLDDHTDDIQQARKVLYAPQVWARSMREPGKRIASGTGALTTSLPTVFRARRIERDGRALGHLRIFTFNVANDDEFITEMGRLVEALPDDGLILDVRGNGGGSILAAEGALQLLTARRIEPQRAQFITTPRNLALCRKYQNDQRVGLRLGRWVPSIADAVRTGAIYSLGYPITDPDFIAPLTQRYAGPVALITDALCYSATDIFAAGFQDHEIGPVVGVHANTGAGGANVWSHALLRRLYGEDDDESPYRALPEGASFRVAIRRTIRVGLNSGGVVEDLGIRPDVRHRITHRDLMDGNFDLLSTAATALAEWNAARASVRVEPDGQRLPRLAIAAPDGKDAECTITIRLRRRVGANGRAATIELAQLLGDLDGAAIDVEVSGHTPGGAPFLTHTHVPSETATGGALDE